MSTEQARKIDVRAVGRAMSLLSRITPEGVLQTALSEAAGVPLPTAYRILSTLIGHHFVVRRPDGQYAPGPALYRMVFSLDPQTLIDDAVIQAVEAVRDRCEETAGFFVRDGLERYCVRVATSGQRLRRAFRLNERRSIHVGASGKVFLAYGGTESIIEALRAGDVVGHHKDLDALTAECAETRARGYAYSEGAVPESWGVAAPVQLHGVLLGALAITAPVERHDAGRVDELGGLCLTRARELSELLHASLPPSRLKAAAPLWPAAGTGRGPRIGRPA